MTMTRTRAIAARRIGPKGVAGKILCALRMDQAGAAAVEFAFVMPILLLVFAGIVQFGSVLFLQNHMSSVARETTRRVAVGDLDQAGAVTAAQSTLINWGVTYNVNVAAIDVGGGVMDYTTSISLPMRDAAIIDVLGLFQNGDLTAAVTMREET